MTQGGELRAGDWPADARALLDKAAKQFRFYEEQHMAKKTPEAYEKAKVNGALAHEIECYLALTENLPRPNIRDEALEEAVRAVESLPAEILEMWDRPGGPPGNGYRPLKQADCVAVIRALKGGR